LSNADGVVDDVNDAWGRPHFLEMRTIFRWIYQFSSQLPSLALKVGAADDCMNGVYLRTLNYDDSLSILNILVSAIAGICYNQES
jgi:hypothetical protein